MKIKTNMFFWRLNNEFANILQKLRSFCSIVFQWAFIRGWYFAEKCLNMVIFRVQIVGWAFIRARAFIRDFTVFQMYNVQSKLFITSPVITEYSISNVNLLGTDLFPLKFPLYIHLMTQK